MTQLIAIFEEIRDLLTRPDADLSRSPWKDGGQAAAEMDRLVEDLGSGCEPPGMAALFGPSGPICEACRASGWDDRFDRLAGRYSEAMALLDACPCLGGPTHGLAFVAHLGIDADYGDVSL